MALESGTLSVKDSADVLQGLQASDITELKDWGVDAIDAIGNELSLTILQLSQLKAATIALTASDVVTLADASAYLSIRLDAGLIAELAAAAVDAIAVDEVDPGPVQLMASAAVALAGTAIVIAEGTTVSILDTALAIKNLSVTSILALGAKGITSIRATGDGLFSLRADQAGALVEAGIDWIGDSVTLSDSGAAIAMLDADQIGALNERGLALIDATDDVLTLSLGQYNALGGIVLAAGDVVTLADDPDLVRALLPSVIGQLAEMGIDILASNTDTLRLSRQTVAALGDVALSEDDHVIVEMAAVNVGDLDGAQIELLGGKGVDTLDFRPDHVVLTKAQVTALVGAGIAVTAASATFEETVENIAAMDPDQISDIGSIGITVLKVGSGGDDDLTLSAPQAAALAATGITLTAGDVRVLDSGAELGALTAGQLGALAAKGVDAIDANDDVLALSAAQFNALGIVALTAGDTITLSNTGAALGALTVGQLTALAEKGVDAIDASDDVLALSAAQFDDVLGIVAVTLNDIITLLDTGAALGALTAGQLTAMAAKGVDAIDTSDNVLALSLEQFNALGSVTLTRSDAVSVREAGATLGALTPAQLSALAGKTVDVLDATDNFVTFTQAQLAALGPIAFAAGDILKVNGTAGANTISGTTGSDVLMGLGGNDRLNGRFGDDRLNGGLGKDILTGSDGRDTFVFANRLNKKTNVDKITDFKKEDTFWLDNAIFTKLGKKGSEFNPATLNKKFFTVGSEAKDGNDYVIHNRDKGLLLYDRDGSGSAEAIVFATVTKKLKIAFNDFEII